MLRDRTIGIVGGSGYLGSRLAQALAGENRVRVIDIRPPDAALLAAGVGFVQCDVTAMADCRAALAGVEFVFHRVGLTGNLPSMRSAGLYYRINVGGTLNVLRASVEHRVRRFVFDSTEFVYGRGVTSPVTEDQPAVPCSVYGATKLVCERAVSLYDTRFDLSTITLRFCRVRDRGKDDVITLLARKIRAREPVVLYDDGRPAMDFVDLDDATAAVICAAEAPARNVVVNVSSGEALSLNEIVSEISGRAGIGAAQVTHRHADPRRPDAEFQFGPENLFMSVERARSLLGWSPRTGLRRMIGETVSHVLGSGAGVA